MFYFLFKPRFYFFILLLQAISQSVNSSGFQWNQILSGSSSNTANPQFFQSGFFNSTTSANQEDNYDLHSSYVSLSQTGEIVSYDFLSGKVLTILDRNLNALKPLISTMAYLGEEDSLWFQSGEEIWEGSASFDNPLHSWERAWNGLIPPWNNLTISIMLPTIADGAIALYLGFDNSSMIMAYDPYQKVSLFTIQTNLNSTIRRIFITNDNKNQQILIGASDSALFIGTDPLSQIIEVHGQTLLTENMLLYRIQNKNILIYATCNKTLNIGEIHVYNFLDETGSLNYTQRFNHSITSMTLGMNAYYQDILLVGFQDGSIEQIKLEIILNDNYLAVPENSWELLTEKFGPLPNSPVTSLYFNHAILLSNENPEPVIMAGRENGMLSAWIGNNGYWQLLATSSLTELGDFPAITDMYVNCISFNSSAISNGKERRLIFKNRYAEMFLLSSSSSDWTFVSETPSLSSMKYARRLSDTQERYQEKQYSIGPFNVISFYSLSSFVDLDIPLILVMRITDYPDLQVYVKGYIKNSQNERSDLQKITYLVQDEDVEQTTNYENLLNFQYDGKTYEWLETLIPTSGKLKKSLMKIF